jgi:GntR family transcriptional regulator
MSYQAVATGACPDMSAPCPATLGTLCPMALNLPAVNPDSGTPKYQQVAEFLIDAIGRGEYEPDTRLPSVDDLVAVAGIAEGTARKALRVVAEAGYARLQPGMGYYVPKRLPPGRYGGT